MSTKKLHPLLSKVSAAVSGTRPEVDVEVLGTKYKLRYPMPEGEDWATAKAQGQTSASILYSMRKPTLAVALVGIYDENGVLVPVETLFVPDPDEDGTELTLPGNEKVLRRWRREKVLEFLTENVDSAVPEQLYTAYTKMSNDHSEAMKSLTFLSRKSPL